MPLIYVINSPVNPLTSLNIKHCRSSSTFTGSPLSERYNLDSSSWHLGALCIWFVNYFSKSLMVGRLLIAAAPEPLLLHKHPLDPTPCHHQLVLPPPSVPSHSTRFPWGSRQHTRGVPSATGLPSKRGPGLVAPPTWLVSNFLVRPASS